MKVSRIYFPYRDRQRFFCMAPLLVFLVVLASGCVRPNQETESDAITQALQNAAATENQPETTTFDENAISDENAVPSTAGKHVVSLGETINTIAEQYGVSSERLLAANKIESILYLKTKYILAESQT